MEILRVVPNSQLWLQSEKPAVKTNLRLQVIHTAGYEGTTQ